MPSVSVIIPCYNQGGFVNEAVDSVLAQSYEDFEIIIVNDGSTEDETNSVLANFDRPKTRIITTSNHGLAAARNNGIREAAGTYILPLDADDFIGPTYLEKALRVLEQNSELGIVYCRAMLFGAVEGPWGLPEFSLQTMLLDNCIFCSAVFRREDWIRVGGYDETLIYGWEDYDFWLSLLEIGRQVYQIPEALFHYRVSQDSMVRARPKQHKIETFTRIYHKHRDLISDNVEVWIEKIIEAGGHYHEATLSINGRVSDRHVRKVEPGQCQLRFALDDPEVSSFVFHPAGESVVVKLSSITWKTEAGREFTGSWQGEADFVFEHYLYFSAQHPSIEIVCPQERKKSDVLSELVLTLEYKAFGENCLPLFAQMYQCQLQDKERRKKNVLKKKEDQISTSFPHSLKIVGKKIAAACLFFIKRFSLHYRTLLSSRLFDAKYYRQQDPQLERIWHNVLAHYVVYGWRERRKPSPLFDPAWYIEQNPEAKEQDPLLHYIDSGEKSDPNPLFWLDYYGAQVRKRCSGSVKPLFHYLHDGWKNGYNPNPFFDSLRYATTYESRIPQGMNPLAYYLEFGFSEPFHPLSFFDTRFYLEDNPSLNEVRMPLLLHYIRFGAVEGRSPNRFFDPDYYREKNHLEKQPAWKGFAHYVTTGAQEKRRPNRLFDPEFYAEQYPHYQDSHSFPLLHYQETGVLDGNYPCREISELEKKPLISIITPVYNTEERLLRRCIHSVLYQAYPHWELCLVDDGSTKPHVRSLLKEYAALDKRIKIRMLEENSGIAGASNAGVEITEGDYVAFLDHDDELCLDTLYETVVAIIGNDASVVYTDESLVNLESRHLENFYKPDFNETLLLNHNYITHFLVARRSLLRKCGCFAGDYSGAQDYDLVLKLTEKSESIVHIPKVLYKWRAHEVSTSINHEQKLYADDAGKKALNSALTRRRLDSQAVATDLRFYYQLTAAKPEPSISVILGPGVDLENLMPAYRTFTGNYAGHVEFIVPVGDEKDLPASSNVPQSAVLTGIESRNGETAPAWRNRAAKGAKGEFLLFLDVTLAVQKGSVRDLLAYATLPNAGMIGCHLLFAESEGRHSGVTPDLNNKSWSYWISFVREGSLHLNGMHCPQDVRAVMETPCIISKSTFFEVGGYDEEFSNLGLSHLDLCYKLLSEYRNIYVPYFVLKSSLSYSEYCRITDPAAKGEAEKETFRVRWNHLMTAGDPYYNQNVLTENGIKREAFFSWYAGKVNR